MAKFDLSTYETVKERKKRFYEDNKDGRIVPEIINEDFASHCLVMATVYRNIEDQKAKLPWAVGYAFEIRDKTLKTNQYGKQYESVNYSSWIENCEESAIGRALDNAGYSGNNKCSREEIEKAKRNAAAINNNSSNGQKKNTNPGLYRLKVGKQSKGLTLEQIGKDKAVDLANFISSNKNTSEGVLLETIMAIKEWCDYLDTQNKNNKRQ